MPQQDGSLLDPLPIEHSRRTVYRFASLPSADILASLDLGPDGEAEMRTLLSDAGYSPPSLEELCDAPFRPKRRFAGRTRFSDGSFPVFYAALDLRTAEAEITHWFRVFSGTPAQARTAYYERFACTFEGSEKDLRPKRTQRPALVDDDYAFCNRLGAEAVQVGLDALVSPSARRQGGTNLPVFQRRAIRDPESQGVTAVTCEADPA